MFPLFESIRLKDGVFQNLDLHQSRMQRSCLQLWNQELAFDLVTCLQIFPREGLWKCKVNYNDTHYKIEYELYVLRMIEKLHLVLDDTLQYDLKYTNRRQLIFHTEKLKPNEDVIFIKNNLLTETSYANIALWNGHEWHTPKQPLHLGTKRAFYLKNRTIIEKDIAVSDLRNYESVSLINSMIDLGEVKVLLKNIIY